MIKAGRMRETFVFEKPGASRGTLGQAQWETFKTVRGEIQNLSGSELQAPQIQGSESTHKIIVRYQDGFKATMRAHTQREPNRLFQVTYVLPDPMLRSVEIYCREIMPS